MIIIVRFCGLVLLFAGMLIASQVFSEAMLLYHEPNNIERMAKAIEIGSNIDKSFVSARKSVIKDEQDQTQERQKTDPDHFRISYFIAWAINLLLLLLLARIAVMAIKTGGELTLYDIQVKQIAKHITKTQK